MVTALLLARVRWWMLGAILLLVVAGAMFLAIPLPVVPLLILMSLAAVWNGVLHGRVSRPECAADGEGQLLRTLLVDTLLLAALLFFSGGATNPLIFLLLLPVAAGALLLRVVRASLLAGAAAAAYLALLAVHVPLQLPDPAQAASLHLAGMAVTFIASSVMLVGLISRVRETLRHRETDLQAAREQALRDQQLLALGALAAGAAHELGTPLATMRLVADELADALRRGGDEADSDLAADVAVLREQIDYCKRVVTGLTERAGVGRCDAASPVAADDWLRRGVAAWVCSRPGAAEPSLTVTNRPPAPCLVADAGLAQALHALLDNARRVDARPAIRLDWAAGQVCIEVLDRGPGFASPLLAFGGDQPLGAHAGGEGLGLLLARRHVQHLGGQMTLANRAGGGARVVIELPAIVSEDIPGGCAGG